jgi:hypothetical protein
LNGVVKMWRCLLAGRYSRNVATAARCSQKPAAKPASSTSGGSPLTSGASAFEMKAPWISPNRADSNTVESKSAVTRPPISARMTNASRE